MSRIGKSKVDEWLPGTGYWRVTASGFTGFLLELVVMAARLFDYSKNY